MRTRLIGGALVALLVLTAGLLIAGSRPRQPELPSYGALPAFNLTDHRGRGFSPTTLAGKTAVVNVVFTRCPMVCPVEVLKVKNLERATADRGDRVAFVSLSVNPDYDTPAVLRNFAAKFAIDSPRWYFVTGPSASLSDTIENGFKLAIDRQGTNSSGVPTIVHGTHLVLVDGSGQLRGYYDSSDPARLKELERDLRWLSR